MFSIQDYSDLIGIDGLSERLLKNHFKLYEGYVKNTNHLIEYLSKEDDEVRFAELKRRFGWEFDGMRLHELFFNNLSKDQIELDISKSLHNHISSQFGSVDKWHDDFIATGMIRGIGWVILYYDKLNDKLFNCWIGEHDEGHLAGCEPILVMDVFEHAYMIDYDTNKKDYLQTFLRQINWQVAEERFDKNLS